MCVVVGISEKILHFYTYFMRRTMFHAETLVTQLHAI